MSNEVTVTYTKGVQRVLQDGLGQVPVRFPMRISFGIQQQSFYDFNGRNRNTVLPVIRFNLF